MKKNIVFVLGILLALAAPSFATFTPQYSTATSHAFDQNADGTFNVYQTVVVDGTTTGDCYQPQCTPIYQGVQCSQVPIPNCPGNHNSQIYNQLNGVGGWTNGPVTSMYGYISDQTTATAYDVSEGQQFAGGSEGQIFCAGAAAVIFDGGFLSNYLEVAHSRVQYAGSYGNCRQQGTGATAVNLCDYNINLWCSDATSPPDLVPPSPVTDWASLLDPPSPPPLGTTPLFWDVRSICVRVPPLPFICDIPGSAIFGHPYGMATKAPLDKAACTCRNKGC